MAEQPPVIEELDLELGDKYTDAGLVELDDKGQPLSGVTMPVVTPG